MKGVKGGGLEAGRDASALMEMRIGLGELVMCRSDKWVEGGAMQGLVQWRTVAEDFVMFVVPGAKMEGLQVFSI
jgi:hypothetical protein